MGELVDFNSHGDITTMTTTVNPANGEASDGKTPNLSYNKDERGTENISGGDDGMNENDHVTHRELDNTVGSLRREFDLHFEVINQKFDRVNDKIESSKRDTINEIKELIRSQGNEQAKAKTQTIRWVIGTGIAVVGLIFTIVKFFI